MLKHEKRENAKYAKCAKMRNPRDTRVRELRTVWERETCLIREMRENARNARECEMRENVKCVEMPKRENAKIAKVVALQQVQYKVLLYGLYAPVET